MQPHIQTQFGIIKKGIEQDVTLVAKFIDHHTKLATHAKELYNYQAPNIHTARQTQFKEVVSSEIQRLFPSTNYPKNKVNYETDWKINIVDHHNILNHPILLSTNIIANIHRLPSQNPEDIVVLSDSGVPMNNFFHTRGVMFSGKKLNIYSHKERYEMGYAKPHKAFFDIFGASASHEFSNDEKQFLQSAHNSLQAVVKSTKDLSFHDQIAVINYHWWKDLFQKDIQNQIPNLFYISNESVARELLVKHYLSDSNNIFTKIICDPTVRKLAKDIFDNVTGCWDSNGKRGSFLFWGVDEKYRAVSLYEDNGYLVAHDAKNPIRIELTADAITTALQARQIYPSMFMVYGIGMFYCGIRPLVGFGSMNYQTHMRSQWEKLYLTLQETEEAVLVQSIPTNGFIGGPSVTYTYEAGEYKTLYALDIMYRGGLTKDYLTHMQEMPFSSVLKPSILDIYDSYVRPENKQEITITHKDLMGEDFNWLKKTPI